MFQVLGNLFYHILNVSVFTITLLLLIIIFFFVLHFVAWELYFRQWPTVVSSNWDSDQGILRYSHGQKLWNSNRGSLFLAMTVFVYVFLMAPWILRCNIIIFILYPSSNVSSWFVHLIKNVIVMVFSSNCQDWCSIFIVFCRLWFQIILFFPFHFSLSLIITTRTITWMWNIQITKIPKPPPAYQTSY